MQNKPLNIPMRNLIFLLGIVQTTFSFAGTIDTIPANDPLIEYTGRIDFSDLEAPRFSYSGVSIRASFTGTSIAVIMDDDVGQNYYNVILDGQLLDTLGITTGKKTYSIADGLENTTHEIELFKRTELTFGKTRFYGFVVDEGESLTTITNERDKLIEYIGNSITCGYGNEGTNGETFGPTTENHYMTYAAFTSRNFNARHLAVCRSGIGVYRNYNGPAAGNTDCMTNYYTRVFLYDENPKYDFADKPDLVCINLGTNDFSVNGGDSALYVSNYFRLIDTIQAKYTMPDIICLLGPMISGLTLSNVRRYLEFIADSASKKGKGNVYFFEMSAQTGDLGLGIDWHPTVAQHERNAMELTSYIQSIKDWKINPLVIDANLTETRHIQLEFNTIIIDSTNNYEGFTVFGDDQEYTIDYVYRDSTDNNILHIGLQQSIQIGEDINLRYTPGTIQSEDSVWVGAINISVQNNLTETKITKAASNSDGTRIIFTCNKKLRESHSTGGLSLVKKSQESIQIDSSSIQNIQLTLFLKNVISRGDTIFADYTGSEILGIDDVPLTNFENLQIENKSTYLSIQESGINSFNIYPNPNNSGVFNYQIDKLTNINEAEATYEVINLNGKSLLKGFITENVGQIDLRGKLSEGIYFIKFTLDDVVIAKSIILE